MCEIDSVRAAAHDVMLPYYGYFTIKPVHYSFRLNPFQGVVRLL